MVARLATGSIPHFPVHHIVFLFAYLFPPAKSTVFGKMTMYTLILWSLLVGSGFTPAAKVQVEFKDGSCSWGSGTVVASEGGESLLLTNRHVAGSGIGTISIHFHSVVHQADFVAACRTADLALLRIRKPLPAATVGSRVPDKGDVVFYDGFAGGGTRERKTGTAHGVNGRSPSQGTVWWMNTETRSGESGSGVFDPKSGELVAVVWGTDGRKMGLTVHLSDIQLFLFDCCGGWAIRDQIDGKVVGVGRTQPIPFEFALP